MSSLPYPKESAPFPNYLVDEVMPTLRDTEWRILCIVVRQTLGWVSADGKGRKEYDWLSQSQFKRRTGRASEAVSKAVDVLVKRMLIEAFDGDMTSLSNVQSRRSAYKIYYRLHPRLLERRGKPEESSESELRKANRTERRTIQKFENKSQNGDNSGDKVIGRSVEPRIAGWHKAGQVSLTGKTDRYNSHVRS